ncbi:MAG TPA: holo-ACP synthase [Clostridia bacterium]|nr:holo-ACP synthase [Clostridia bacterium]
MFIQGVGTDIIEIQRIAKIIDKFGNRFLNRVYSEDEILYAENKKGFFAASLAARFAAKEAVMKALGTGVSGAKFKEIEITSQKGRPEVLLKGMTKKRADSLLVKCIHLSLSHCGEYAIAFAVAEREVSNEAGDC